MPEAPIPHAAIGHNSNASLAEVLEEVTSTRKPRLDELVQSYEKSKEVTILDKAEADKLLNLLGMIREHLKTIEADRVREKEPYLTGTRTVDGHFSTFVTPLKDAETAVLGRIDAWHLAERNRIQAERATAAPMIQRTDLGVSARATIKWSATIDDPLKLAEALAAINKAGLIEALQPLADKLVRGGARELAGCTITSTTATQVRSR